jgi:acetate kinase
MPPQTPSTVLVLNAGSSSIKFALFPIPTDVQHPPRKLSGAIAWIGNQSCQWTVKLADGTRSGSSAHISNHGTATELLLDLLREHHGLDGFTAVGHRIVHGGPDHFDPERIGPALLADFRRNIAFAPEHLPQAIALIESIAARFPSVPQIACFDTAFHKDLPAVARTLPLPRRLQALGMHRYGFHGLSYEFLLRELARVGRSGESDGRVILAHLGNGASLAALHHGKPLDTTMGMTPAGGLVMSTRTGDLDPGLVLFLERHENLSPEKFHRLVNHESGLLGVAQSSGDMRLLSEAEAADPLAAEAVELFCYSARKWIGAMAAALGGLDTLVFSGGIGEHQAEVRRRVCNGLAFLGIELDPARNAKNADIITRDGTPATVRVIPTDEEATILRSVLNLLPTLDAKTLS